MSKEKIHSKSLSRSLSNLEYLRNARPDIDKYEKLLHDLRKHQRFRNMQPHIDSQYNALENQYFSSTLDELDCILCRQSVNNTAPKSATTSNILRRNLLSTSPVNNCNQGREPVKKNFQNLSVKERQDRNKSMVNLYSIHENVNPFMFISDVSRDMSTKPSETQEINSVEMKQNYFRKQAEELFLKTNLRHNIATIYNEDETYKTVIINEGARALDVCKLLLRKGHLLDSPLNWQLYEEPADLTGFERQIEDHEFIFDLYGRWPHMNAPSRLWFRRNPRKYHLSDGMKNVLMRTDVGGFTQPESGLDDIQGISEGTLWLKRPQSGWMKAFCFVLMSVVFYTKRAIKKSMKDAQFLLDLSNFDIYVCRGEYNCKNRFHSPTAYQIVFLPSTMGFLDPEAIFVVATNTAPLLRLWSEGLRFHKHGRMKLADNLINLIESENSGFSDHGTNNNKIGQALQSQWARFDGIIYQNKIPYLVAQHDGELRHIKIDKYFDHNKLETRYQVRGHNESFASLNELQGFYRKERCRIYSSTIPRSYLVHENATRV